MNLWEEAMVLYETLATLVWRGAVRGRRWWRVNALAHRALRRASRRFEKGLYR